MTTNLTFNIASIGEQGETFIKLAGAIDKVTERLDVLDHQKADPKVTLDTSEATRKLDELKTKVGALDNLNIGQGSAIAGGLALGAGALAAGGLLAIPAAIAAIGIASEKSNPEVVQAFSGMTAAAKETARDGFSPLVPAIVGFANNTKVALTSVKSELAQGATAAAPLLTIIGDDFLKAAQQGIGASVPIIQSVRPAAQALGDDLVKIEQGTVGFLKNLNVGTASQGLAVLGTDVEQLLPPLGTLVSDVVPVGNAFLSVLGPGLTSTATAADRLAPALSAVASGISFLGPDIAAYAPPALAAIGVTKLLTGSYTDFGGVIGKVKGLATDFGGTLTSLGQKVGITTAAANEAKAAQAAEAAVAAELAKADADVAVAEAEAAFAADTSAKNAIALTVAQDAQAAAAKDAAVAERTLATTSESASFAFGPLGIALGAVTLLALPFISNLTSSSAAASKLAGELGGLQQAASSAQSLAHLFQTDPNAQSQLAMLQRYGVTLNDLTAAQNGNLAAQQKVASAAKSAQDAINAKSDADQKQLELLTAQNTVTNANGTSVTTYTSALTRAQHAVDADKAARAQANQTYSDAKNQLDATTAAQAASSSETSQSAAIQQQAAGSAAALGVGINRATAAYQELASGQAFAMTAAQQASDTFLGQVLAVNTANATVHNYFKTADAGVKQASQSLSDASHSYTQSAIAISDAQHSEAQAALAVGTAQQGVVLAQRGVADAIAGVTTAENNVTKARTAARQAQIGLTAAEAAATEQLKQLHLQLTAQVTTEESARVALFDQQQSAAKLGVTAANAQGIASQKVTATNEDRINAAIALLQAEESLNSTLDTGSNLRKQVSSADKAGVAGSQQVIAARQAIIAAQDQVFNSEQSLIKAHQAEADAQANVTKAEQGVKDALYNEQKAQQAVTDALYNRQKAQQAVASAQAALTAAQDADSHSRDISTAAGARNYTMLKQIADQLFANETPTKAANDLINDTATLFGITNGKARALLTSSGLLTTSLGNLTKKPFRFDITSVANVDLTKLKAISLPGTGGHITAATGGQVFGPGGPRDDKIPAMLSNREYVQPVDSVDYYGVPFMNAVRQKRLPRHFADGGLVADNVAFSALGAKYQAAAEAETVMGKKGWPLLPAYVAPLAAVFGASAAASGLGGSRAANEALMQKVFASMFGWTGPEWAATQYLMMRESGFNNLAQNPTSTAFGQFQFLDSTWAGYGIPKTADSQLQDVAGGRYIKARYRDPSGAAAHERAFNWYSGGGLAVKAPKSFDTGGWLDQGVSLVHNGTGGKERVRTGAQEDALLAQLQKLNSNITALPHFTVNGGPQHSVDQLVTEVMRRLTFHGRG